MHFFLSEKIIKQKEIKLKKGSYLKITKYILIKFNLKL